MSQSKFLILIFAITNIFGTITKVSEVLVKSERLEASLTQRVKELQSEMDKLSLKLEMAKKSENHEKEEYLESIIAKLFSEVEKTFELKTQNRYSFRCSECLGLFITEEEASSHDCECYENPATKNERFKRRATPLRKAPAPLVPASYFYQTQNRELNHGGPVRPILKLR